MGEFALFDPLSQTHSAASLLEKLPVPGLIWTQVPFPNPQEAERFGCHADRRQQDVIEV